MRTIKWLVDLSKSNPMSFVLALMLIVIMILGTVVQDRDAKLNDCNFNTKITERYYSDKIDSINKYYAKRESDLTQEVRVALDGIILDLKTRLEKQTQINEEAKNAILKNKTLINGNKRELKNLSNAETN